MWPLFRTLLGITGVSFLSAQLIKLFGFAIELLGPLQFLIGIFDGIFPFFAQLLNVNLGLNLSGLDIMSASVALSATFIIASSVTMKEAMKTWYFFRLFMIPYALLVVAIAIIVQVSTPLVELSAFSDACKSHHGEEFYGSTCADMTPQLKFLDDSFGTDDSVGTSFLITIVYLVVILPLIAVGIFFFKRLSVHKLLKRVVFAALSAIAIILASTGIAIATGDVTMAEVGEEWFGPPAKIK